MDLVVEDGTGVVTANAYATADEIDDILSYHTHTTAAWNAQSDEAKDNLIIWATEILDQRVKWFGYKTHDTQGIGWPRTCTKDKDGIPIDDDIVPDEVKKAVATLAGFLITGNPDEVNSGSNITMIQADVITLKFDPYARVQKFPDSIAYILRGLGYVSMGGGGAKRIIKH